MLLASIPKESHSALHYLYNILLQHLCGSNTGATNWSTILEYSDLRVTIRETADELNLSLYEFQSILIDELNMNRVSLNFIQ